MSAEERLAILAQRRDQIRKWLAEEATDTNEQKHLDADTPEQAYWHHGYQSALDDMIDLLSS
jgi:predicted transcriptional regulator